MTGRNNYTAPASTSLSNSYVAPTTTATTNDNDTTGKYQSEQAYKPDYSQQYSEDIEDQQPPNSNSMGTDVDRQNSEEDAVMIDKGNGGGYGGEETVNGHSRSYSQAEETEVEEPVSYTESIKHNHLNSLFNGHLMKWKYEAEEGSGFIRIPACKFPHGSSVRIRSRLKIHILTNALFLFEL